ncbi:putative cytosine-specific methyltransferase [Synechococcus phage Ssp-JY42]|nr:5-cytosine DNA methyltransferase [Synechococcus phage Yong-M4-211]
MASRSQPCADVKNARTEAEPSAALRVLDLFSGLGAYSLGLERTGGFKTVAFCEINEFCRRVLRRHWTDVPIYDDVTTLTGAGLRAAGVVPDWIVAGWPCQGISSAGTGLGLDDARSGLWTEVARLAGELRPQGLLLENSSNLLSINGGADFGRVLGDLAALGYDAEWHCLPAAAFDAPHIRDRLWIVATLADAHRLAPVGTAIARLERHSWEPEPDVGRVATGVADRVERLHALGNLNPPIVPEVVGRAILTSLQDAQPGEAARNASPLGNSGRTQ